MEHIIPSFLKWHPYDGILPFQHNPHQISPMTFKMAPPGDHVKEAMSKQYRQHITK